jgi:quinol monooxygenase YgiN
MADGENPLSQRKAARHQGAVCVIVRLEAAPGADASLARMLNRLAASVIGEEPGCTSYYVTRQIGSPLHFAVHARFADWAAFEAHAETAHMERVLPCLTGVLATPVALEIFLEI